MRSCPSPTCMTQGSRFSPASPLGRHPRGESPNSSPASRCSSTTTTASIPVKARFRDWAKARRAVRRWPLFLSAQVAEYRRGTIVTQKELGLPATEYFLPVGKPTGKKDRFDHHTPEGSRQARGVARLQAAGEILRRPLFSPTELKKSLTDADARKVFHGLFLKSPTAPTPVPATTLPPGWGSSPRTILQFVPQVRFGHAPGARSRRDRPRSSRSPRLSRNFASRRMG